MSQKSAYEGWIARRYITRHSFLLSDGAKNIIQGKNIAIDGGWTAIR
jgi:hypothetical protein